MVFRCIRIIVPLGGSVGRQGPSLGGPGSAGDTGGWEGEGDGPRAGPGMGGLEWGPGACAPGGARGPKGRGSRCELEAARAAIRFGGLVTEGVLKCTSNPQDLARKRTRAPPHFQCTPRSCTLAARTLTMSTRGNCFSERLYKSRIPVSSNTRGSNFELFNNHVWATQPTPYRCTT